jgi:alpha-glucoside transport system substrate-binding protein
VSGVRRRTLLGAIAAVAPLAGCGSIGRTLGVGDFVRVAVSWSATELAAFRAVLAGWGADDPEVLPLGDDIDAALGARTAVRPNVVALPQLGSVLDNIEPLPNSLWRPEYDRIWSQRLPAGERYALPFKLAHKSVVWYRKQVFDQHGLETPSTWNDWLSLNDTIARTGLAPLALGGADGWMLDGFFENVLLRNFERTYDTLTRDHDATVWASDDIRATFELLAQMWGRPGALAGGTKRALVQQFPDAVLEVFRYGKAAMVVAPDFAESVIRHFGVPNDDVGTFTFPPLTPPGGPLVFAGDLLVASRPLRPEALDLISYLGTAAAPIPWIRDTGGFIAANSDTDRTYYSPTLARLSDELRTQEIRFDLSDQLGAVGGREGLQLVLQNFLERLGDGTSGTEAARIAVRDMLSVEAR